MTSRVIKDGFVEMPEFPVDKNKDLPKFSQINLEDIDPELLKKIIKIKNNSEKFSKKD